MGRYDSHYTWQVVHVYTWRGYPDPGCVHWDRCPGQADRCPGKEKGVPVHYTRGTTARWPRGDRLSSSRRRKILPTGSTRSSQRTYHHGKLAWSRGSRYPDDPGDVRHRNTVWGLFFLQNHPQTAHKNLCLMAQGFMDLFPGEPFTVVVGNFGKRAVHVPKHTFVGLAL